MRLSQKSALTTKDAKPAFAKASAGKTGAKDAKIKH
jgi:hypothetical protein